MTRLRLTTEARRFAVGYDPDLSTYYAEVAPPGPIDPDEGLVTVRGRGPRDVPEVPALTAELNTEGVVLTDEQLRSVAADQSGPRTPFAAFLAAMMPPKATGGNVPPTRSQAGVGHLPNSGPGLGSR